MMRGGNLYELAKILGHSNIKMTERYAKLARQHIARTGSTARKIWKQLDGICDYANVGRRCSRLSRESKSGRQDREVVRV
jgi:hypothetical protein